MYIDQIGFCGLEGIRKLIVEVNNLIRKSRYFTTVIAYMEAVGKLLCYCVVGNNISNIFSLRVIK